MTRPLRIDVADGIYHVMSRGIDRKPLFLEDKERLHFLEILALAQERFRLRIYAYVLMENHFHLIICTPDANLSKAMQWIKQSYSMWFNLRHKRVGPLFQGRFRCELVDSFESWLIDLSIYVHLNPVRLKSLKSDKWSTAAENKGWVKPSAEVVRKRMEKLRSYRWSSYGYYAGYRRNAPEWLDRSEILRRFDPGNRYASYRRMVEQRILNGHEEGFIDQLKNRLALGSVAFREQIKSCCQRIDRDIAGHQNLRAEYSWAEIVAVGEQITGSRWHEMNQRGNWGRYLVYWGAQKFAGMTLREIALIAGYNDYGAVNMGIRRFVSRSKKSPKIRHAMKEMTRLFNVQT